MTGLLEEDRQAAPPAAPRGHAFRLPWSERTRSLVVICALVLVANAPYLLHVFNPNPVNLFSGLGTVSQPGPFPGYNYIDPNVGFTAQALGHRAAVDWLHGQVPWWNPYEGVGAPLAGEMQAAALFPLNAFNLLPDGQVYFRIALECLAGVGTYLLVRRFTRSSLPAVAGGVAFALNGTFAWMFHAPANPVALLPFVLLGVEWAREGAFEQRRRGWVLIAVALALSLYAGFPETAFLDGLLAGLWLAVRLVGMPRRAMATYVQSLALGAVVGVLLAAPILVAFLDYLPHAYVGGHGTSFANLSISANTALPAQVMPYLFGPIAGFQPQDPSLTLFWGNIGGYLGAAVSALGVIGLAGRRHRALRIALGAWVVLGLLRLVGVGWALDLVNLIPGVRSTAFYRYAPPSWEMAVVVLAVLGLDDVLRREASRRVIAVGGAIVLVLCLLCWHAALPVLHALAHAPNSGDWARASFLWAVAVVVVVVVVCCLLPCFETGSFRWESVRGPVLAGVVILDAIVLFATPEFSAPRQATIDTAVVRYLDVHLGDQRFYTLGPLGPNYGSYFGLSSLDVNDLPIPKAFYNFVPRQLDPNVDPSFFTGTTELNANHPSPAQELIDHLPQYQAMGVRYVILPAGSRLPGRGADLRLVYRDATADIVELPHAAPLFGATGGGCTVRTLSLTAASVDCSRPSTVVYRELSMPGWQAQAGGRSLGVHPDGPLFQSVDVPAGASTVQFSFTPPHEVLALVAFLVGLLVLALALPQVRRLAPFNRPKHRRAGAWPPTRAPL
ncbi:MAG TPA: hypothetical protein VHS57_07680 [Acidimicrobiales bacterium]|nr:hypothetical protein [Acidimicrobiales bacterium]